MYYLLGLTLPLPYRNARICQGHHFPISDRYQLETVQPTAIRVLSCDSSAFWKGLHISIFHCIFIILSQSDTSKCIIHQVHYMYKIRHAGIKCNMLMEQCIKRGACQLNFQQLLLKKILSFIDSTYLDHRCSLLSKKGKASERSSNPGSFLTSAQLVN